MALNHYPFHVGDFDRATRHLTRMERSVYRDMIDLYMVSELPLTLNLHQLKRKILANSPDESTAVEQVLNEFFTETPSGWFHARCDEEIMLYQANTSQKAAAGKASALAKEARKQEMINGRSTPVEHPLNERTNEPPTEFNGASTNQEPRTKNQEPRTKKNTSAVAPPDGVCDSVWSDFVSHRKAKGAKLTQTAIDGIQAEASKAGWGLEAALRECCTRGWTGFKADWVRSAAPLARASPHGSLPGETAYQASQRRAVDILTGRNSKPPITVVESDGQILEKLQ